MAIVMGYEERRNFMFLYQAHSYVHLATLDGHRNRPAAFVHNIRTPASTNTRIHSSRSVYYPKALHLNASRNGMFQHSAGVYYRAGLATLLLVEILGTGDCLHRQG
jgi:hypothetical protein